MTLTEAEAGEIVQLILASLQECGAHEVMAGIEESRQQGIEETFQHNSLRLFPSSAADMREVGMTHRRPPTNVEMLRLVLERLHQRLIVLPAIAQHLHESFDRPILWRVDSQFVSGARTQQLQADVTSLLPPDLTAAQAAYRKIHEFLPELAPAGTGDA